MVSPLLIRGGSVVSVVTADDTPDTPLPRDLELRDGVITDPSGGATEELDARGCLVFPGLVNGHDHLRSMLPSTRRADTSALADVIEAGQRASVVTTPADYRALTALASARQLLSGTVGVVDHVYPLHRDGMLQAIVDGHADVGLRAHVAYGLLTAGPAEVLSSIDAQLARAVSAADEVLPADRLYLAPVSLRQTSVDGYRAAVAAADRTGLRLYTHVAESTDEVEQCLAEHGKRPIELLHDIGFLRPGTVLVHCVQLSEREIDLLAQNSVAVAYCPSNHLKLAKGVAPVLAMREAGVRVCLGVDGMTDLFAEMRQAVYVQGSAARRPGALDTQAALRMATADGCAALGEKSGWLRPGDPADLITVRMDNAMLAPLTDPAYALVHRGSGAAVRDVVVAGEPVVREGALVRADLGELIEHAWQATRGIAVRSGRQVPSDWSWQRFHAG
ncbi:S-adenosylhomocysteine deaminase [Amycolatopsis taiwanensis]|uniref:S-adenosylhomocysteine deaminase n=1 Tax=Amycolatopsis taiwanensis TaxID=342230 RepID=A0A9W6R9V8_9PSEU|nr:S-adenosylhomocysteine deaminase [Amycolatopsis taiwanensis]